MSITSLLALSLKPAAFPQTSRAVGSRGQGSCPHLTQHLEALRNCFECSKGIRQAPAKSFLKALGQLHPLAGPGSPLPETSPRPLCRNPRAPLAPPWPPPLSRPRRPRGVAATPAVSRRQAQLALPRGRGRQPRAPSHAHSESATFYFPRGRQALARAPYALSDRPQPAARVSRACAGPVASAPVPNSSCPHLSKFTTSRWAPRRH